MLDEGLDAITLKKLGLKNDSVPVLTRWNEFLSKHKNPKSQVTIGLIGKYVELQDSYKSILEAFIHAGAENEVKVDVEYIHSEHIDSNTIKDVVLHLDGILVAPGFGERGVEGKIDAVRYARENNLPFFGICLGMQMAVIEAARNVANIKTAGSEEFDHEAGKKRFEPVVYHLKEWVQGNHKVTRRASDDKGGTMRLGAYDAALEEGSKVAGVYGTLYAEQL